MLIPTMQNFKETIVEMNEKLNLKLRLRKDYLKMQREILRKKHILEKTNLNIFSSIQRAVIKRLLENGVESRPLVYRKDFGKKDVKKINILLELAEKFQKFQKF